MFLLAASKKSFRLLFGLIMSFDSTLTKRLTQFLGNNGNFLCNKQNKQITCIKIVNIWGVIY